MQNINFVDYEKKAVNSGSKKIKISLYDQLMNKVNEIRIEKQNLEKLKKEARDLGNYIDDFDNRRKEFDNVVASREVTDVPSKKEEEMRKDLKNDLASYIEKRTDFAAVSEKVDASEKKLASLRSEYVILGRAYYGQYYESNLGKKRPIRMMPEAFSNLKKRFASKIKEVFRKTGNMLKGYGFKDRFGEAVDKAIATQDTDEDLSMNADSLSTPNEEVTAERKEMKRPNYQDVYDFVDFKFGQRETNKTPMDEKFSFNRVKEEIKKEQKEEPKVNDNVTNDYNNSSLDELLSQFNELRKQIEEQVAHNTETKNAYDSESQANNRKREDTVNLAKEKESKEKAMLEFVRNAVASKNQLLRNYKAEGIQLEDQLNSERIAGQKLDDDISRQKVEIEKIDSRQAEIVEMLGDVKGQEEETFNIKK